MKTHRSLRTENLGLACWVVVATTSVGCGTAPRYGADIGPSRGDGLVRHPDDTEDRFDERAVMACLDEARGLLRRHALVLEVMSMVVDRPGPSDPSCRSMRDDAPFRAFEGWWAGQWGRMPVAHLWLTVQPGVQLVLISDGGHRKQGINLMTDDGVICGLVMDGDGRERLHQGRFFPATANSSAYLKWLTPQRNYYERVTCSDRGPTYRIVEQIVDGDRKRWGTVARYGKAKGGATLLSAR